MSYLLPHLHHAYAVDQAILSEESRVVVVRFGRDHDPQCMRMDELLAGVADKIKAFACVYLVDVDEVRTLSGKSRGGLGRISLRARAKQSPSPARTPRKTAHFSKKKKDPPPHNPLPPPKKTHTPQNPQPKKVPDFNAMYELYDPCTVMFFFRNKHIMVDLGTGNNNKINWPMEEKQEFLDIVECVYRGARKGRGLVVSPKDYSTRYRY